MEKTTKGRTGTLQKYVTVFQFGREGWVRRPAGIVLL